MNNVEPNYVITLLKLLDNNITQVILIKVLERKCDE